VSSNVENQLDLEAVGVDTNGVEPVGPHALEPVRPVGVARPVEQANEETNAAISESTEPRNVLRAATWGETASLNVVRASHQRVSKCADFRAIHGAVSVHDDKNVAFCHGEAGAKSRTLSAAFLLNDSNVGMKNLRYTLRIVT
jgi:hypothetical protein